MYQLRYYYNARDYNIVGRYPTRSLAFGIRKKLAKEQPKTYSLNRLKVIFKQ